MLQDLRPPTQYKQNSEGLHFLYDTTRDKWLSVERSKYLFDLDHVNVKGQRWLSICNTPSNLGGYVVERLSIITMVTFSSPRPGNGTFRICLPDETPLYSLNIDNESFKVVSNLNIPVEKNSKLSALLLLGEFDYPKLTVEIAPEYV
jgi:hypothetical protein